MNEQRNRNGREQNNIIFEAEGTTRSPHCLLSRAGSYLNALPLSIQTQPISSPTTAVHMLGFILYRLIFLKTFTKSKGWFIKINMQTHIYAPVITFSLHK